jgi:hypothetical protein
MAWPSAGSSGSLGSRMATQALGGGPGGSPEGRRGRGRQLAAGGLLGLGRRRGFSSIERWWRLGAACARGHSQARSRGVAAAARAAYQSPVGGGAEAGANPDQLAAGAGAKLTIH